MYAVAAGHNFWCRVRPPGAFFGDPCVAAHAKGVGDPCVAALAKAEARALMHSLKQRMDPVL